MTTRVVGATAGIGWLKNGINLGRNNPGAVFGGAALLMVAVIGVALAGSVLVGLVTAAVGNGATGVVVGTLVVMVLVLVLLGMLMVGYLRLVDAVENGRPASATDVFSGFGDTATSFRTIGLLVLLAIIQNVLMVGLLAVVAGDFLAWYMQMLQVSAGGVDPSAAMAGMPAGMGLAYVVMILVGTLFFGVQAIGLGQIALRGRGVLAALGDGFAGAIRNLLPLLMLMLAYIALMIVVAIVVVVLVMLVGLLAKLVGAWLAVVIGVPLYLAFLLALVVVSFGVMYHLWRDVCGGSDAVAAPGDALTA